MQNLAYKTARSGGRGNVRPTFRKLISDRERRNQRERLRYLQKQDCDTEAEEIHRMVLALVAQIPAGIRQAITVPSVRVFSAVLGLIRCAVTLEKGTGPIAVLELSAAEIAEKAGYSRSTVQAALRWLCGDPIHVWEIWVADGLGILERQKRFAMGMFGDQIAPASRTSAIKVALKGKILLRLLTKRQEPLKRPKFPQRRQTKAERAVEKFRKAAKNEIAKIPESDAENEDVAPIDLRPRSNDAESRAIVVRQIDQCLMLAFLKPKASLAIFPNAEEFRLFNPQQQEKFFALVDRMEPEQQALVPMHVHRQQV